MKAAVCERYGPPEVVVVRETPAPKLREGEILVRVEATTVTTADARLRALRVPSGFGCLAPALFGFGAPRRGTLGVECAGVVDAVAGAGSRFRVGDRVVGMDGQSMITTSLMACASCTAVRRAGRPLPGWSTTVTPWVGFELCQVAADACGSASMTTTFWPRRAKAMASSMPTVVRPMPPLSPIMTMT